MASRPTSSRSCKSKRQRLGSGVRVSYLPGYEPPRRSKSTGFEERTRLPFEATINGEYIVEITETRSVRFVRRLDG